MMMKISAAIAAALPDFKIPIHKGPLTAFGAFSTPALPNGREQFSLTLGRSGFVKSCQHFATNKFVKLNFILTHIKALVFVAACRNNFAHDAGFLKISNIFDGKPKDARFTFIKHLTWQDIE